MTTKEEFWNREDIAMTLDDVAFLNTVDEMTEDYLKNKNALDDDDVYHQERMRELHRLSDINNLPH